MLVALGHNDEHGLGEWITSASKALPYAQQVQLSDPKKNQLLESTIGDYRINYS